MTTKQIGGDLLQRASLFTISLRRWGNQRKADLSKVQTKAKKGRLHLTKKLIESNAYDDLRSFQDETKSWCLRRSMPSYLRDGIFVVLLTEVKEFEDELARRVKELENVYVPRFLKEYEKCVEDAKVELEDQFNSGDYPPPQQLTQRFRIEWNWISFGVPDNLPEGVRKKEVEKIQKAYAEAQQEIVAALRQGFADLVNHAVERLSIKKGEKPKTFRNSLFENFREFFDTFNARNLMEDEELKGVVQKAKKILAGVRPDDIRERPTVREATVKMMADVKRIADQLVQERPSRRFKLDED